MNKYTNHVYVIPEDEANRQLADGFILHHEVKATRIKVMPPAGGWRNVLDTFRGEYIRNLRTYLLGHVVMLIDFDDHIDERRAEFEEATPSDLKARVFVIGSKNKPETLKKQLRRNYEEIGRDLADNCDTNELDLWHHEHLIHNASDLQRLEQTIKQFLF